MPNSSDIVKQIQDITSKLISLDLSVEQNYPSQKDGEISYSGNQETSVALRNISYEEIYNNLNSTKNFNIKMIDGALIHLLYRFDNNDLISHRLAFFPSPSLDCFQNEPDLYQEDEVYADILSRNIVTFPIRFDFSPDQAIDIHHPHSHLTLGQYKNCRIPVSEPLTPSLFIDFILRNFYNTAHTKYSEELAIQSNFFQKTISENEQKVLHLNLNS